MKPDRRCLSYRPDAKDREALERLAFQTGLKVGVLGRLAVREFIAAGYSVEQIFALNAAAQQTTPTSTP